MPLVHPPPHMPHQHVVSLDEVGDLVGLPRMLHGELSEDHDFGPELSDVLVHGGSKVTGGDGLGYGAVDLAGTDDALICGFGGHARFSHDAEGRG